MASAFDQLNPYHLYGQAPTAARTDGAGLPRSTTSGSTDHGPSIFSPDSAAFWLALTIVATALGIGGASVKLHAGPARLAGTIGKD